MAGLGALLAVLGLFYANTGRNLESRITSEPPQRVPPAPARVPLTAEDRDAARAVAEVFIDTAVLRQQIDKSWEITAPSMRSGFTRKQWKTGNIPVVPFPAAAVADIKYQVDFSGSKRLWLKVAIVPKPASNVAGQAFDMGLERAGAPEQHRWLVDYWVGAGIGVSNPTPAQAAAAAAVQRPSGGSAAWLLVPIGLIGGMLLSLPIILGVRGWYRSSRAERSYRSAL